MAAFLDGHLVVMRDILTADQTVGYMDDCLVKL